MNSSETIRVLIVDDSPVVRRGIRAVIESEPSDPPIEIVGEASSAAAALNDVQLLRPDVVLLDLRLPDDSGLTVCRQLRQLLPKTCILVLTSSTDNQSVYETVLAGAHGYLLKEIDPASLIQAIQDGHAGRPVFTGQVATSVLNVIREQQGKPSEASRVDLLSPQELKVLAAIAAGHSNKEIAELLGLSTNTVKNYIANMFQKLGVERRAQAMALYLSSRQSKPDN